MLHRFAIKSSWLQRKIGNPRTYSRHLKPGSVCALYLILLVLVLVSSVAPELRYIKYLSILPVFFAWALNWNLPNIKNNDAIKPFLVFLALFCVHVPNSNSHGFVDAALVFISVVYFALYPVVKMDIQTINFLTIAFFIIFAAVSLDSNNISFSLLDSTTIFEDTYSFIFGLFAVFWITQKRYFLFFLNFIFMLFSLKRVAFLGVSVCIMYIFAPKILKRFIAQPLIMVIINMLLVWGLVLYGLGHFDEEFLNLTNRSANALGQGRQNIFFEAAKLIIADPLSFFFTGLGPGSAYSFSSAVMGHHANFHSDILKLVIEYGFLGLALFVYYLYRLPCRLIPFAIYFNVLLLTDNVLIYMFFTFFYLSILLSEAATQQNEIQRFSLGKLDKEENI